MAWSTYRKVLIALLCIAQLVFILLLATYLLWGFTWSPWSHSEKCPNFCQCVLKNAKTQERTWSGNLADLDGVNGDGDEYPDESWANIPPEFYSFLMFPQPPGFPESKKDVPTTRKKTTSTTQTTTTTERPYRYPPIASVSSGDLISHSSSQGTWLTCKTIYICTGAVLGRTYMVVTKSCVSKHLSRHENDYSLIYAHINSNYTLNENPTYSDVNVFGHPQVEYFKDLAKLRFKKPIGNDTFQYAQLLKRHVELKTAHAFVWTAGKPEIPVRKIEVDVKGTKLQLSTPLFMIEDDTYYLFGFADNGRIIPNIYSTEYGKWLEKP